jgi:plastocyanin
MKKLLIVPIIAIVLALAGVAAVPGSASLSGGGTVSAQASQTTAVTIQNFAFSPATITVQPGTTVTWTNKDTAAHTVTADSGTGPKSGNLNQNQTYSFKFDTAGTYAYHCEIHPNMKATVVVASSTSMSQPTQQQQSNTSQQPSQTVPTGGQGAGTGAGTSPTSPAAGAVAAGSGPTSRLQHTTALIVSTLSVALGLGLAVIRRRTLSRS